MQNVILFWKHLQDIFVLFLHFNCYVNKLHTFIQHPSHCWLSLGQPSGGYKIWNNVQVIVCSTHYQLEGRVGETSDNKWCFYSLDHQLGLALQDIPWHTEDSKAETVFWPPAPRHNGISSFNWKLDDQTSGDLKLLQYSTKSLSSMLGAV